MFTLIRGAEVYAPVYVGKKDILLAFDRIAAIGDNLGTESLLQGTGSSSATALAEAAPFEVVDARDKIVVPGFIDQHVHMMGGGGEGGFSSRTRETEISDLLENGITTAVGVLGVDAVTRSLEGLYAKARMLDIEGITTFIYTGSYQVPPVTFTGSVQRDIVLVDKVLGAGEIAVADHRSFQPTFGELARLAAQARNGGMISGKAGVVHLHMGDNPEGLSLVFEVIKKTGIPARQLVPTHINRNLTLLAQGRELVEMGGYVDFTAGFEEDEFNSECMPAPQAVKHYLELGVKLDRITMSSDGNGSLPVFDAGGELIGIEAGSCKVLFNDVRKAVLETGIPLETVLKTVTVNPAACLRLDKRKGLIAHGGDADLVIMDKGLNIETVYAMGKKLVDFGKYVLR